MTNPESEFAMPDAISDFRRARQRALVEDIIARLQRKSNDLLAFEEVRQKLHARAQVSRGLQEIPIDAIVGSVGRYSDFNRHFLPRSDRDQTRWVRVMAVASDLTGFPPIEAYKIGSSYFVLDGNHRVSVVRELGGKTIPAYVTEIETRVPFDPNTSPDELIIKSEYADSLEHTQFDRLYPDVDLSVTVPGQYQLIENHICAQHGLPGGGAEDRGSCTMDEKAVRTWYETTYKPVIAIIRERGMLRDFPDRTETDLYVWIVEHRAALEEELGWEIAQSDAADHLVRESSPQPGRVATRIRERLLDSIRPELFEAEPPLGAWRQERLASVNDDRLFADILVPVNGQEAGWWALAQAIGVARHEGGRLAGLYVVASEADRDSETTRAVRAEFEQRCVAAGVQGKFAVDIGGAAQLICDRVRWTDLVVVKLTYPPGPQPLKRYRSGFRALIQRCARPMLIITDIPTPLHHGLLSYDGSPKSQEALYMATYLARQWQIALTVITVIDGTRTTQQTLDRARDYLTQHEIQAAYVAEQGPVAASILRTAEKRDCDVIIVGGYTHAPLIEIIVGSNVDHLLRESYIPILVCR